MKSEFLKILHERGFVHQITELEALDEKLNAGTITAYIGFDATADSLHVGSLVQIMMLRWLQKTGHRPIILMGGGTTKIGDPSGKDTARQLLDNQAIQKNIDGIQTIFQNFISFGSRPTDALILNNNDWLEDINYIEFLRDFGRHFSVNRMLSFDSVKLRLEREQPLSFLEFNYMILQAYDFLILNQRYQCFLQMGGSDQWGNIVNGVELTRRIAHNHVFGLTSPLITTSSGAKMGKTASGAIWLNADKLPAYEYWQFWRNTEDADVGRYLRLFTEIPMDEVKKLEQLQGAEINEAKKILADAATTLAHGKDCLPDIHHTIAKVFEHQADGDVSSLPSITIPISSLNQGIALIDLLVEAGLCTSKSEARRLIQGNGARLNDSPVSEMAFMVSSTSLLSEGYLKLSSGKKKHAIIYVQR
jgi:tyrosyl-tRNA synthetase